MAEAISEVKLKVGELTERVDYGRGIVRISARDMKRLGVNEGDVVEIEGTRKTVGIAVRAYPADVGLDVARMDGLMRRNSKASISELVKLHRADVKEAKRIVIAPTRKGIIIRMSSDLMKRNVLMRPFVTGDILVPNPVVKTRRESTMFEEFFGMDFENFLFAPFGEEKFIVVSTDPKGPVRVTRNTEIELLPQATSVIEEKIPEVTYEDLGGLREEMQMVREMIELPLKHPELFERLGIEPPKGVLLHGPPGCGKTLLAKAVANESGARFYVINGPEVMCVDGKTEIRTKEGTLRAEDLYSQIKTNGKVTEKNEKIEVVKSNKEFFVECLDDNRRLTFDKIDHAFTFKAPIYRVRIGNDIEVRGSQNQPLLVKEGEELVWKKIKELKGNETVAKMNGENIDFEKIASIENLGDGTVYDFAVNPYSNFIGGNPAVLPLHNSKFYGESLTPDESIFTMENGLASVQPIGEVVKAQRAEAVAEFDDHGRVEKGAIKSFIEHPFQKGKKIFEVTTSTGRKIKVTDYHSLFALKDGKIADIKTSDIAAGDTYLAIPSRLPAPETYSEIDILKELGESKELKVRSPQIKEMIKSLGAKRTADILGIREKYSYDIYGKNVCIPIMDFLKLSEESKIPVDDSSVRIVAKQNAGNLPVKILIDEDMATVIGLFIAEGSYTTKHAIRITNELPESKEVVRRFCKKYGIKLTEYEDDMLLNSKPLKVVFEKILQIKTGASKKAIPPKLMSMPLPLVKAMLKGYFTGDGSVYPPKTAHTIEATTVSRQLANDLMHTLLFFGIVAKCSTRKERTGSISHRVLIQSPEGFAKFREIGFLDAKRNERIEKYLAGKKFNKTQKIPIWPELREIIKSNQRMHAWSKSKTIGKDILAKELGKTDPKKEMYKDVWNVIESDLVWDMVREKKEISYDGNVYDVSVNPNENFVAGFGGIFCHNSEENLRKIFEQAEKSAPSIVFIDEIDAIAPKREEVRGEVEKRVVSQLLTLLDGLKSRGKIVVIGATNIPNAIDPALRRGGRLDREISIGVPDTHGRKEILQIHTRGMPLDKGVNIDKIAGITHGYVGADITALTKEAAMHALRRVLPDISTIKDDKPLPDDILKKLIVTEDDFNHALKMVQPSAMREVLIEIPNVKWEDIGGLGHVKQLLNETIEWPLKNPEAFKTMGIRPPKGVMLYGPPGCGKTLVAKAVANESGANFIYVKAAELLSMWVGESEKHVREVFKRAKQVAPSIICFDEIDALAPRRGMDAGSHVTERVVSQLLAEMSGLEDMHDVVVIAATNRPDIMDGALLRPGRFDRHIFVPTPDVEARLRILEIHAKDMPLEKVDLNKIADKTNGYSGADLEALCREAAMNALRKDIESSKITMEDFDEALEEVKPSVSQEMNALYQKIMTKKKEQGVEEDVEYIT